MFETKKIQTETLSEYLKAVRTTFKLSIEQASEMSGVNLRLLKALEDNKQQHLPAAVYVQGVLKQLANFYNLDQLSLLEQYKREREIVVHLKSKEKFSVQQITNFWKQLVITPKFLAVLLTFVFITFTLGYLFWQVMSINKAPDLEVFAPKEQDIIKSLSVQVLGDTDQGATVLVNNQEIFVDGDGKFKTEISLTPGAQEINVTAKNRFGKQTLKTLKVFIQPEGLPENKPINLSLKFLSAGILNYSTDMIAQQIKNFSANETFLIQATSTIVISAQDGGQIVGVFNGQNLGVLGKIGVPLKNLSFSREQSPILNK